jgi:polar amino acid transport system permease protein
MLKTTSLVLAVPFILDLQYATNAIGNRIFQPVPLLLVAAIWYLAITSVLMVGQHYLEQYYGRGFDPSSSTTGPRRFGRGPRQPAINAAHTTPKLSTMDDMGRPASGAAGGWQ